MTQRKPRAIVLDYNPAALRALEAALHALEFAVAPTTDPNQVLRWLERHRPHVMFVDFAMPGLSGEEFLAQARQTLFGPMVPTVGTGDALLAELPPGTVAWLARPVREDGLLEALEVALAQTPESKAAANEAPPRRRAASTAAYRKPGVEVVTLSDEHGSRSAIIEACVDEGLRIRSKSPLALGTRLRGSVEWIDPTRGPDRSGRVILKLRVDSASEADDGFRCGLTVLEAKPPQWWRRFVAKQAGG